jgi:hypothetical protein
VSDFDTVADLEASELTTAIERHRHFGRCELCSGWRRPCELGARLIQRERAARNLLRRTRRQLAIISTLV